MSKKKTNRPENGKVEDRQAWDIIEQKGQKLEAPDLQIDIPGPN